MSVECKVCLHIHFLQKSGYSSELEEISLIISREEESSFFFKLGVRCEIAVSAESDGSEEITLIKVASEAENDENIPIVLKILVPRYKSAQELKTKLESFLSFNKIDGNA